MGERPHYHGHRKRLQERFRKAAFAGFAEHEVIELLLTLAIPRVDVKQPAKALLRRLRSLRGVMDATIPELQSVEGIGEVAAVSLHIVRESATRFICRRPPKEPSYFEIQRVSENSGV